MSSFFSPYGHQFIRVGACVPAVAPAEPERNTAAVEAMLADGDRARVALMVFPELCLSAYAIDDLLFQDAVLDAVERQVAHLIDASRERFPVFVVGAPLRAQGQLYNCAVAIHRGRVLGVVPKVFLPNYREFYERRHFASGIGMAGRSIALAGHSAPFGADLLFAAAGPAGFTFHVEICEDLWVPQPPSTAAALAGAEILLNLSASNITIGKAQMRRLLCASQAARCLAAYAYSAAGAGESTTDLAWDGQAGIFELGEGLAETERFSATPEMAVADVDLGRIRQERMRTNTFGDCVRAGAGRRGHRVPHDRLRFRRTGRADRVAPQCRALSLCAGRPGDAERELLRGLQHPGPGAGAAAAGDRARKARDRRLGRARLDPGADRRGPRDGPARAAAHRHPGLYAAGLCHRRDDQGQCLAADEGARRQRRRDRHPPGGAADAPGHRPRLGQRCRALRCDL